MFIFCSCFLSINKLEKTAIYCSLGLTSFPRKQIKVFYLLEVRKSYWHKLPKEGSTVNQMEHSEVGLKCPHSIISIGREDKNPDIWVSLSVSITDPEQNYAFGGITSTYGKIFYHVHMACSLWIENPFKRIPPNAKWNHNHISLTPNICHDNWHSAEV